MICPLGHTVKSLRPTSELIDKHFTAASADRLPSFAARESSNLLRRMLNSVKTSDSRARATPFQTTTTSSSSNKSPSKHLRRSGKVAVDTQAQDRHVVLGDIQNRMPTLKSSPSKAVISVASSDIQATAHLSHTAGEALVHASSRLERLSRFESRPTDISATKPSSAMRTSSSPVKRIPERVSSAVDRARIGYDGSGDAPGANEQQASKPNDSVNADESFDTMGVTKEDFDTRRPDPKSAQHYAAVNDFFRDLRKREFKAMNATKHKNAQGKSSDRADKGT